MSTTLRPIDAEARDWVYLAHQVVKRPGVQIFYELYDDVDAFEAHERSPHVQRFLAERAQHLRADPELWVVEPMAGVVREPPASGVAAS